MKSVTLTSAAATLAALTAVAAPTVSNVLIKQATSDTIRIDYSLDEAAVVTLDILTNATAGAWASIGADNLSEISGDVGVRVLAGRRTIYWKTDVDWMEAHKKSYDIKAAVRAWSITAPPDYMVVDLRSASQLGNAPRVRYYAGAEWVPGGVGNRVYKTTKLLMRKIPAKGMTFRMGSPNGELGKSRAYNDWHGGESLFHVTLTNDFYLGVYELTRMQAAERFGKGWWNGTQTATTEVLPIAGDSGTGYMNYSDMRGTTYQWPDDGHQVTGDSWLGGLRNLTGIDFDLPTEAQWEFACRAGTTAALYNGLEITSETTSATLDDIA